MANDPAFLFYDGDAAKDVSHLTRLERGCYFDIIQAQRKFGRLSIEIIKRVLGKDFDECWEDIKICLSCEEHMYFISWLEESTLKRKEYSESRRKNRLKKTTYVNHMENEIVNKKINGVKFLKDGNHVQLSDGSIQELGEKQKEFIASGDYKPANIYKGAIF